MDPQIKNLEQKHLCLNHKQPAICISMDRSLPILDRLLCSDCKTNKEVTQCIPIEESQKLIEENIQEQEQKQTVILQDLNEFTNNMIEKRSQIFKRFEEIQNIIAQWIQSVKQNLHNCSRDLGSLISLDKVQRTNNLYHLNKIDKVFSQLLAIKNQQNCLDLLKIRINDDAKQHQVINEEIIQTDKVDVELINTIKQTEISNAIAFNNQASIMVAGCGQDIIVWIFNEGKMIEKMRLNGHTNIVRCLVFSKKQNWFASGSSDCIIWKESNKNWVSMKPEKCHASTIYCILLNNQEDQLITCSADKTIKAWKVDCSSNQLEYEYTFESRHTNFVMCISFNGSETLMVSCGFDKKIILWKKEQKRQWIYVNDIMMGDHGKRISFINESMIAWQQQRQGLTHIFECKNEFLIRRPDLNLQLDLENDYYEDYALFPTILNNTQQIIIQKHNQYVYIIKNKGDGKLRIVSQPINCSHESNYGALTNNGQYLIIWNEGTHEFRVFNLKYE